MNGEAFRGRGAGVNPANRFERVHVEADPEAPPGEHIDPRTEFLRDASRSILARNESPDVGFEYCVNPYRGCEHGCSYCYARPYHEYLGMSAGVDFETRILVKADAPALLRAELSSPRWKPAVIAMSGVTDAYQPAERRLRVTRGCLEVLAEFRNPVAIITKNHLVTRDLDLLKSLAEHRAAAVYLSITTLDPDLQRILEPRASTPARRLAAMRTLADAGIPVGVMVAPILPGITDHEVMAIVEAAGAAGARFAGRTIVRLPGAVEGVFDDWLRRHLPDRREKVLMRIRQMHDGQVNDSRFGLRMSGTGVVADQIHRMFVVACRTAGLDGPRGELSTAAFRIPPGPQMELF